MKPKSDKQIIDSLIRRTEKLQLNVELLQEQQLGLRVQSQVLASCCELLHSLRTGSVHPGWIDSEDSWLPDELPLLEELGTRLDGLNHPGCSSGSQPQQQPQQQWQQRQQAAADQLADHDELLQELLSLQQQLDQQQPRSQHQQQQQQQSVLRQSLSSSGSDPALHAAGSISTTLGARSISCCSPLVATATTTTSEHQQAATATATATATAAQPSSDKQSAGLATPAGAERYPLYLAPAGDFLAVMRHSLSQPPYPGAADMTLQQFAEYYTAMVKDMALHVALCEQPQPQQQPQQQQQLDGSSSSKTAASQPLQVLHRLGLRHTHVVNSILLLPRNKDDDLMNKVRLANLETLELSDDPEKAWQCMDWLADQLNLSKEQEQTLIAGGNLFKRLIESVRSERQQLSRQQSQQGDMRLATGRALDLEGQEEMARRLAVLVKKERWLVTLASIFISGVLTVVQMAKSAVLCWPHAPQIGLLGAVLLKRSASEQQQQLLRQPQRTQRATAAPVPPRSRGQPVGPKNGGASS